MVQSQQLADIASLSQAGWINNPGPCFLPVFSEPDPHNFIEAGAKPQCDSSSDGSCSNPCVQLVKILKVLHLQEFNGFPTFRHLFFVRQTIIPGPLLHAIKYFPKSFRFEITRPTGIVWQKHERGSKIS
jgi:hypothetical protein